MIHGIGTDLIEVNRIEKAMQGSSSFQRKLFSSDEIAYCESIAIKYQAYAARFAAKEAFMKALGTGWSDDISWTEIEILREKSGKPYLKLSGRAEELARNFGIVRTNVSLTHLKDYAAATVILES